MNWRDTVGAIIAPMSRNIARVVAGYLIGAGYFSEEQAAAMTDDMAILAGFCLWGVVEFFYILAKRKGWTT